ncbi:MAG: hypothetical protein NTZ43_09430 [Gemmatimonadetes bacterium]|nr:hypothetical protein [Gemmatimonadota bacterium]
MFFAILEVLAFAVPVVGFANRRKAWGRSLAFMVSDLRAGFTGW